MTEQATEAAPPIVEPVEAVAEPVVDAFAETAEHAETLARLAETEGESDDDKGDLTEKPHKGKSATARIDELTRLRREAERERDFYKGLATQTAHPSSAQDADVEPEPDQFEDYADYVKALARHEVRREQVASVSSRENIIREAQWESRVEAVRASHADYEAVVGSSEQPIAGHVYDALMDSERGPEMAYHMATHPEIAERLNRMSPIKAALELGRLETSLAAPTARPASKAPPPTTPLKTTGSTVPANLVNASMDAYIAERRKQGARF